MDDVDELLRPREPGVTSPKVDAWKATTRVLRGRRWWRRGRAAVMMAGCFVAGALVMYRPAPTNLVVPTPDAVAIIPQATEPRIEAEAQPIESPKRLERWAKLTEGDKQRNLFRRAGDGFLKYGDEIAALRCYRRSLDGGTPTELAINVEDTWMLMSLKISQHKE